MVAVEDGTEPGSVVVDYTHAVVDDTLPNGRSLPPDWALQIPEDWCDVLRLAVPRALRVAGVRPEQVIGIATDLTACTVLPATVDDTPLCELPSFADRPHAYPKLRRHHAAQPEADAIVARAEETGQRIHQDGAYPDAEFLASLHPDFAGFVAKLDHPLSPLGAPAGKLSAATAELTGLREGTVVAVGNADAHVTGAAARALEPGHMLAIMGTSTCHIMNSDVLAEVPGMCGVVRDGVVPGLWGYEAGQSGVGDIFARAVRTTTPQEYAQEAWRRDLAVHELLTGKAAAQPIGGHGPATSCTASAPSATTHQNVSANNHDC